MAKSQLRLEAVALRKQGISVKEIAKKLGVSKSTASLWVRDVILSVEQLENLRKQSIKGTERGRLINAFRQKHARLSKIEHEKELGVQEFKTLSSNELKTAGLSLYWAEGDKKNRRIKLANSDPQMIKFHINWLEKIYRIPVDELSCQVGINEAHQHRDQEVREFWSQYTGIPLKNFTKTSFKKFPLRKVYENFNNHHGTLAVTVRRSARIYYKIMGQIHGLSLAT